MFRPCIDLHDGKVKQIVGGTLDHAGGALRTNFVSDRPASYYADLYRRDNLSGGHVVMLGPGNEDQARGALAAYPGGLQVGGGINLDNALAWLNAGASHVIVTSWLFPGGKFDPERLSRFSDAVGKQRLVIDLSCRRRDGDYFVVIDRFQTFTNTKLSREVLRTFQPWCAEILIHAVDVEGLCRGIDEELVIFLAENSALPTTYAGGARSLDDLERVHTLGKGRIDMTIGSALDIFGGTGICYSDAVAFNREVSSRAKEV